jgi:glutamyl-Q tRNA(Asp) synthetase
MRYRGRFAPSPTGLLHFGSLVAATASFLDARAHQGQWLLRIEDLDRQREVPGAAAAMLQTLEAFGFEWDGSVVYQSAREHDYREHAEMLRRSGLLYPCGCSRQDIRRVAPMGLEGPVYPGTCRNGLAPDKRPRAERIRTTDAIIDICDAIQGQVRQNLQRDVGDFLIRRADGLYAYQLAVVVDDAWQGITDVVRGADLLFSTPRQIYLQRTLKLPSPNYAHIPLAVDKNGKKLSKQATSQPVDPRYPARALRAALAHLGQTALPTASDNPRDILAWAIQHWDIARVPRQASSAPEYA